MTPPAFILPATIGISAGMVGAKFASKRQILLAVTVGSGVGIYLLFGFFTRSLGFTYLVWVALSSATMVCNLQVNFRPKEEQVT